MKNSNKKMLTISIALFAATSTMAFYSNTIMMLATICYIYTCVFAFAFLIMIENTVKLSLDNFFNTPSINKKENGPIPSPDKFVNNHFADRQTSIPTREDISSKKNLALAVFNYYLPFTTVMIIFSIAFFIFSLFAMSYLPAPYMFVSAAVFPLSSLAFFGRKKSLQKEIAKLECGFKEGPDWYFGFFECGLNSSEHAELLKNYIDGVRAQGRNLTNMEFALLSDFDKSNGAFKGVFDGDLKNRPI